MCFKVFMDLNISLYVEIMLSKELMVSNCGTGEENDNPLQCDCLENPRDGGPWWAAVYGVTQSWT